MKPQYAYFREKFVPVEQANVSIRCKGLNYGLGCFEGIRAYWTPEHKQLYIFRVREHFQRLQNSCRILHLAVKPTADEMCALTKELLRRNQPETDTYIRPLVYASSETLSPMLEEDGNEFAMFTLPLGDYLSAEGLRACVSSWTRVRDNMIPARAKPTAAYLNSALARREAKDNGFDEAIFLNANGYVSEGSAEHVFLVIDGTVVTPTTQDDNLNGITRATLVQLAAEELGRKVELRHVTRTELYTADEVFFCGTGAQVVALVDIDHRAVGDGKIGPVTKALAELYSQVVHARHKKYAAWCEPVY